MPEVKVQLIRPNAKLPYKATSKAAKYDVYACDNVTIPPGTNAKISIGLAFDIPFGHYIQVWDRSGLSSKQNCHVLAGTIDEDYKQEVFVVLANLNNPPMTLQPDPSAALFGQAGSVRINEGDRIAQISLEKVTEIDFVQVESIKQNGRGGFGSTGS